MLRLFISIFTLLVFLGAGLSTAQIRPFAFAVLGDYGCGCVDQKLVADRMIQWHDSRPFQTVITVGDNIYGSSFLSSVLIWQDRNGGGDQDLFPSRFDGYYQPLISRGVKFHASLGNHDLETNQGRDLIDDRKRFNILRKEGYYSFTPDTDPSDLVSFFALNSNTLSVDPDQLEWLEEELSENDSKWKIVYLHHPLYSSGGGHGSYGHLRELLEPLLVEGGVRVVFAGHNHYYARMKPQKGIVHFVTAGGGKDLRATYPNQLTARTVSSNHFMYCEVTEDRFEYWAIPPHGSILDHGSITFGDRE